MILIQYEKKSGLYDSRKHKILIVRAGHYCSPKNYKTAKINRRFTMIFLKILIEKIVVEKNLNVPMESREQGLCVCPGENAAD